MKNTVLTLSLLVIMSGAISTKCQISTKQENKAHNQENNLADNQCDSVKVLQDTTTTYQKFIAESEKRINTYEQSIAELKTKIAKKNSTEKTAYEKKLAQLEQKNQELKTILIDYKNKQIENWDEKQIEFRNDLDDLGKAIADFFVKAE
jgi:TolA-binding protein